MSESRDPLVPVSRAGSEGPDGPETAPVLSNRVVFRDLIIFQIKLFLDGVGDLVLAPISLVAFLWDMIPGGKPGRAFYGVLRLGERWDRWLTLYKPSQGAGKGAEGLLEAGLADANTFLGKVEQMVRPAKEPKKPKDPFDLDDF